MNAEIVCICCAQESNTLTDKTEGPGLTTSESDLVAQARAGSLEAFDRLVSMHQARVHALAYRFLGDEDEAADVQQDTFVRAWRSLRRFRQEAEFATWLHRITVNVCLSRRTRKRRNAEVPLSDVSEPRCESGGVSCLVAAETALTVRRVLDGLPSHYRALVVLREIEGRSFEEIGQVLGCSPASARTRASKARIMLRERLRPYIEEENG